MHRLAVVSDSHIPDREPELPEPARDRLRSADHVVHAGDFTTETVLNAVESLADGDLTAVSGNVDPHDLGLPTVATLTIEDVTFVVTHGTGSLEGYQDRVAATVRDTVDETAVGIAGHTHEVLDTTVDGVRLLNPGSVTGANPASTATMMTVAVDAASVTVTVHEIDSK